MLEDLDPGRFRGKKVGVLTGGRSAERSVSLKTGKAFADALEAKGYEVGVYDVPTELPRLISERPAAVILGLHGGHGENGSLQGLLNILQIPYTGSGVLASALAMDKARAKAVLHDSGVPVAEGRFVAARDLSAEAVREAAGVVGYPLIAKPNDDGSSFGVHLCRGADDLDAAIDDLLGDRGDTATAGVLVERFIEGEEYTVGFFGAECLGAIRIEPGEEFYDFTAKYASDTTRYHTVDDEALRARLESLGRATYEAIGCRGVARVDLMGTIDDLKVLELNTIPGMTATSLVPKMAARLGIGFDDFTELMLCNAAFET